MSYLTPLSTIELNLRQTTDKQLSEEKLSMSPLTKKLPKWLIEFESFSISDPKMKIETNTRPLTESSVGQRPQWFQELAQQRRSSEVFTAIETNGDLFSVTNEKSDLSPFNETIKRRRNSHIEDNKHLIDDHIIAKSYVSIPKEMQNYSEPQIIRKGFENTFKSCDNLLFEMEDNFMDFIIPELPFGQQLVFEIINNWGDEDFVGLNGIEIIDLNGSNFKINKTILFTTSEDVLESVAVRDHSFQELVNEIIPLTQH
ncbi:unnamed protein product [Medioppia subpectinata]|uniref:KATNIP domain-containing protein n=1 Tax=Medioppia subpectinata TaxID=1979941 RepID=A0A7R9LAZ2_9ACAR|nr:unnamed protein product [Medioppia subpectinata]CAG2117330.1 unnamed protein product [Medioppia subpectinata]